MADVIDFGAVESPRTELLADFCHLMTALRTWQVAFAIWIRIMFEWKIILSLQSLLKPYE